MTGVKMRNIFLTFWYHRGGGDFRAPETFRRIADAADTEHLDRTPYFTYLQPGEKHKDFAVCSNGKIKGGRKKTCYFC